MALPRTPTTPEATSPTSLAGTGPGRHEPGGHEPVGTGPVAHGAGGQEYEDVPVPAHARRSLLSVSAVWLGFPMILTCAVFGGMIVYSLGFWRGMLAIALGNIVLMLYVGSLSVVAGRTGRNFALTAAQTFGRRGYLVPSAFLATVVIGWFAFQTGLTGNILHTSLGWNERLVTLIAGVGFLATTMLGIRALAVIGMIAAPVYVVLGGVAIWLAAQHSGAGSITAYAGGAGASAMSLGAAVTLVIACFADSGTMTADFTRWSRSGREGFLASASAFPFGNAVALVVGGVIVALGAATDPAKNGGSFLGILIAHGGVLVGLAAAFVFINLGSVCTHCLYNGAVGWGQLTGTTMRKLTVVLGVIGIVLAVIGIWTYFEQWLNLLGVIVPPIGTVLILDQLVLPRLFPGRLSPDRLSSDRLSSDRLSPDRTARSADSPVRWQPFAGWAAGSASALVTHMSAPWLSDAVVGIVVTGVVFSVVALTVPAGSGVRATSAGAAR